MSVLYVGVGHQFATPDDAFKVAQPGDEIVLSEGTSFSTIPITVRVPPAPAPASFTLVVSVNGAEKAREAVSVGDKVEIRVE